MFNKCTLTGHRDLKNFNFDYALLDRTIQKLIDDGVKEFYCGMAVGFDIAAAESILSLKRDVKITACLPYREQGLNFSSGNRLRYERILKSCDEVIVLNENYVSGCMLRRDRFMVDNSDVVLCFLRKKSGGTFYTVNYARSKGLNIIEI